MPFPEEKEPDHKQKAEVGYRLKAFTERSVGVLHYGTVKHVNRKDQIVTIDYGTFAERRPFSFGFYYVDPPELSGQEFKFI